MSVLLRGFILFIAIGMVSFPAAAKETAKAPAKSLDEEVQELKTDTLSIGTQMRLLEEKLLYPTSTQVAVFVSMESTAKFRIDSMEIQLDGKPVAQHFYPPRELEALQKGGVQRIYTGNVKTGEHGLQVIVIGKSTSGSFHRETKDFKFSKDVGPKVVELHLGDPGDQIITLREW